MKKKKKWAHIGFIAPGFLIYTIFMMIPLAFAFYYSVFDWNGIGPKTFVGLDNFIKLFTSTRISRTFFAALLEQLQVSCLCASHYHTDPDLFRIHAVYKDKMSQIHTIYAVYALCDQHFDRRLFCMISGRSEYWRSE